MDVSDFRSEKFYLLAFEDGTSAVWSGGSIRRMINDGYLSDVVSFREATKADLDDKDS